MQEQGDNATALLHGEELSPFVVKTNQEEQEQEQDADDDDGTTPGGTGPVGRWRYGVYECWSSWGLFLNSLWCLAACFPSIVLGQLMTRFNLDTTGALRVGKTPSSNKAFRVIFFVELAVQFVAVLAISLVGTIFFDSETFADSFAIAGGPETTKNYVAAVMKGVQVMLAVDTLYLIYFLCFCARSRLFTDIPARWLKISLYVMMARNALVLVIPWIASFAGTFADIAEKEEYGAIQPESIYTPSGNGMCYGYPCVVSILFVQFYSHVWHWIRFAFVVAVGSRVRGHIRRQHAIRGDCGDCIALFMCACPIVTQMASHNVAEDEEDPSMV